MTKVITDLTYTQKTTKFIAIQGRHGQLFLPLEGNLKDGNLLINQLKRDHGMLIESCANTLLLCNRVLAHWPSLQPVNQCPPPFLYISATSLLMTFPCCTYREPYSDWNLNVEYNDPGLHSCGHSHRALHTT